MSLLIDSKSCARGSLQAMAGVTGCTIMLAESDPEMQWFVCSTKMSNESFAVGVSIGMLINVCKRDEQCVHQDQ